MINWAFTSPSSPACYSSIENVYKLVRKRFPKITRAQVEHVLQHEAAYTLHKPGRKRFKRRITIPAGYLSDVQVDLADMQKLADENQNFKYILVGVDVLSRQIFAAPTKSKASNHMIAAFNRLFRQMPALPQRIFSDKGMEFQAREMKSYFRNSDIHKIHSQDPDVKASMAERAIQTLKRRIFRCFSKQKNSRWLNILPDMVKAINSSINRSTKMRPVDVNFKNEQEVWDKLYGGIFTGGLKKYASTRYMKGDKVRIAREKTVFTKSYLPRFTEEVFEVEKARNTNPTTYDIRDKQGETIHGKYYNPELSRTKYNRDRKLKIEQVLKVRTRPGGIEEYLVKFKGQPEKETATWITAKDVDDIHAKS